MWCCKAVLVRFGISFRVITSSNAQAEQICIFNCRCLRFHNRFIRCVLTTANANKLYDFATFAINKVNYYFYGCKVFRIPLEINYISKFQKFRYNKTGNFVFGQSFVNFLQYIFRQQWQALKAYANGKGIKIIGDIPLYVAADSSDLWSRPELFQLDEDLKPTKVAGVPPDYFSKKGQLWGNPLYNWNAMRADNYDWWIDRISRASKMYDVVRIDHFRGLDRYYAVPAGAYNAVEGEWEQGPGMELFNAIGERLGDIDIIAEDLGILDDGVLELREKSGLPGMKILMFAFDGNENNDYLPRNIPENSVTYTGTHDNDTALGFLYKMNEEQFRDFKKCLRKVIKEQGLYMPVVDRDDAVKALCLCALNTRSYLVVLPVQDVLRLDNTSRMNTPAVASGNWTFRLEKQPDRRTMAALKRMIVNSGR